MDLLDLYSTAWQINRNLNKTFDWKIKDIWASLSFQMSAAEWFDIQKVNWLIPTPQRGIMTFDGEWIPRFGIIVQPAPPQPAAAVKSCQNTDVLMMYQAQGQCSVLGILLCSMMKSQMFICLDLSQINTFSRIGNLRSVSVLFIYLSSRMLTPLGAPPIPSSILLPLHLNISNDRKKLVCSEVSTWATQTWC